MNTNEENNLKDKFLNLSHNGKILWILILFIMIIFIGSLYYQNSFQQIQQKAVTYNAQTSSITKITIDPQGRAWMRTWRGPLVVFDEEKWDYFEKVNYISAEDEVLSNIAFDHEGKAWIGTWGNGYIILDGERWERSFSSGDYVSEIAVDSKGRVWVGNLLSVIRVFDGDSVKTFDRDNSPLTGFLNEITYDSEENVWIGTRDGLFVYNGDTWQAYSTENSGLVDNQVQVIGFDSENQAWIGTKRGLSRFTGDNWQTIHLETSPEIQDCIEILLVDNEDKVWVLSYPNSCPSEQGLSPGIITVLDGNEQNTYDQIGFNSIRSMALDPQGQIWFITESNGIIRSEPDLNLPLFQNQYKVIEALSFLEFENTFRWMILIYYLWVLVYVIGSKPQASIISILIPIISFLTFSFTGFDIEGTIYLGNLVILIMGIIIAVKGIRTKDKKVLAIIGLLLNIGMIFFHFAQFIALLVFYL